VVRCGAVWCGVVWCGVVRLDFVFFYKKSGEVLRLFLTKKDVRVRIHVRVHVRVQKQKKHQNL
jgi:hypothetical protein